jgi:hypothetical protein
MQQPQAQTASFQSEGKSRRFWPVGKAPPGRLETLLEKRQTGMQRNRFTLALEPVVKTFFIGHGQQLARRRAAALVLHNEVVYGSLPPVAPSRQVQRRLARKATSRSRVVRAG